VSLAAWSQAYELRFGRPVPWAPTQLRRRLDTRPPADVAHLPLCPAWLIDAAREGPLASCAPLALLPAPIKAALRDRIRGAVYGQGRITVANVMLPGDLQKNGDSFACYKSRIDGAESRRGAGVWRGGGEGE